MIKYLISSYHIEKDEIFNQIFQDNILKTLKQDSQKQ